ncbi:glycosyltransferase family 2 protein [Paenibacillus sp. 1001270B_150601_E10]|uniref:glycosyltransferase family 2 protein n=1 Tax=Paenibacillus sp. 1001270B_150601_E10 TaxID=2787079 RepID=UPI001E52DC20|nr:glycosyltransferase [Paenibacillus sp. 1001270B_150601_E10]
MNENFELIPSEHEEQVVMIKQHKVRSKTRTRVTRRTVIKSSWNASKGSRGRKGLKGKRGSGSKQRGRSKGSHRKEELHGARETGLSKSLVELLVSAGERDGGLLKQEGFVSSSPHSLSLHLRKKYAAFVDSAAPRLHTIEQLQRFGETYLRGVERALPGQIPRLVLIPSSLRFAVVMSALNEEGHIGKVLQEINRLAVDEMIVVVNGSTDRTLEEARVVSPHATIVHYPERVGHDVGRSIGAKLAKADAVLFVDSDIPIPAEQLAALLWSITQGVDVALNNLSPLLPPFAKQDSISHCKQWLNACLGRSDLEANSLTAVPHALSRKAIDTIGIEALCVPPRAQALALLHGLRTEAPTTIDVITHNQVRQTNTGTNNQVAQLILGDHLEALHTICNWKGSSLDELQHSRRRIAIRRNGE